MAFTQWWPTCLLILDVQVKDEPQSLNQWLWVMYCYVPQQIPTWWFTRPHTSQLRNARCFLTYNMASVQLYVYDLSNGMARQLSRQLTGRQIDGIWQVDSHLDFLFLANRDLWRTLRHTSVVVYGKEIFYGQGINITQPGRSHASQYLLTCARSSTDCDPQHGQPLQMLDMGETALDEETFNEYLEEIKTHYTADKVRSIPSLPRARLTIS